MIHVTVGISGSGKTSFSKRMLEADPDITYISTDDLRVELSGDVNDQSKNARVFSLAFSKLEYSCGTSDCIFDATNLDRDTIKTILGICKKCDTLATFYLFRDSEDPNRCRSRVLNDIDQGIDRSNTLGINKKGFSIIDAQYQKYKAIVPYIVQLIRDNSDFLSLKTVGTGAKDDFRRIQGTSD